jgi:DNA polymerase-3 subunit gamma/tau
MSNTAVDRVLALSMRPKFVEDFVGQDEVVATLKKQFDTERIPHFYIIHGPVGSGKTSLARILSLALQRGNKLELTAEDWQGYKRYDINEINAANKNGIDDIRAIVDTMKYQPMMPSKAKVVIMDEAHQLTTAAQNALITETEDVAKHVFYIFCTSNVGKIIPALQRRAYMVMPKPLGEEEAMRLLTKAAGFVGFEEDLSALGESIQMASITSPGLILQAAEKFFSGIPPNESVYNCDGSKVDTMKVCRSVAAGSWKDTAENVKGITKTDVIMVRNCLMGYLKTMLLKSTGNKALVVAKAIRNISDGASSTDDMQCLPSFLASVCIACEHIASGIKSR